jgi:DNA-3-methyladenine glycosylase I
LESAQAGLSWLTILRKRDNYRKAFADFDVATVAAFGESDIQRLMQDKGIVRNQLKIKSAITNAQRYLELQSEKGSFSNYLWGFVGGHPIVNDWTDESQIPTSTVLSDQISKDMKVRGFKFFGTTICYAYLQAMGVVNDHIVDCFCRTRNC